MKRLIFAVCLLALVVAGARAQAPAPLPDAEWKKWLNLIDPLLMDAERKDAKTTAPSQRTKFQEAFWAARNPNPAGPDNPFRVEIETRMAAAEKRFLINGRKWNDCGRTFLLLGKPDWQKDTHVAQHFGAPDPLRAFQDQEQTATEQWLYRSHPSLPPSPRGISFRFNPSCESMGGHTSDQLLSQVATSYVVKPK